MNNPNPSAARCALVLIGNDRLPCRKCGKEHKPRELPPRDGSSRHGVSWADPDDGHVFARMGAAEFARQVLSETGGE